MMHIESLVPFELELEVVVVVVVEEVVVMEMARTQVDPEIA